MDIGVRKHSAQPIRETYYLTQRDDSSPWFVIEHCERWDEMEDLEAEVPSGTAVEMVVVLHTEPEALSAAGVDVSDFVIPARPGGDRVDDGGGIGSDLEHDELSLKSLSIVRCRMWKKERRESSRAIPLQCKMWF